ncbi:MAG: cobalamin biosynthesis protein CobD [Candidatus Delongbacteria bacterium]|nr:cobalamin biosynthesis protein CobD [Candidatus Delongbacteria bacterium]MBN2835036.1 cobalamin biosynthesis protein CobD [Candidatus Delongbacteria bacterium]
MDKFELLIIPLIIGFFTDYFFGDPEKLPHLVVYFGKNINFYEKIFYNRRDKLYGGVLLLIFSTASITFVIFLLDEMFSSLGDWWCIVFRSIIIFYIFCLKTLIAEGNKVIEKLSNLVDARKQLSRIVGRDTNNLDEQDIRRAIIETQAENLNDGIIAPLFYYAIGGLPFVIFYKVVNTLDSMVGYKNQKYELFGKASAIADDIMGFIPARISAALISIASRSLKSYEFIFKHGHKHKSPNSGYPESAMAGALDIKLNGPLYYDGILEAKPWIGDNDRVITEKDNILAASYVEKASLFGILLAILYLLF